MAAATEVTANEVEIKQAMSTLRLDSLTTDLIDEIKLNQRLKRSLEQDDRGEVFPIAELKKQFMEKLANGYYCK
jgi:hypothetical protein